MLFDEKSIHALMQSVMSKLMRANKVPPFLGKLFVNDDKTPAKLPIIKPFGRFAEVHVADMDTERLRHGKRIGRACHADKSVNEFVH